MDERGTIGVINECVGDECFESSLQNKNIEVLNKDNFSKIYYTNSMLFMYGTSCGYCKAAKPEIEKVALKAHEENTKKKTSYRVFAIDAWNENNALVLRQFPFGGKVPTIFLMNKQGDVLKYTGTRAAGSLWHAMVEHSS